MIFLFISVMLLGKLYSKKGLWHLADKELRSSRNILSCSSSSFCCAKCKLMLEATLEQCCEDLNLKRVDKKKLLSKTYQAREKLNCSVWINLITSPQHDIDGSPHCKECKSFTKGSPSQNKKRKNSPTNLSTEKRSKPVSSSYLASQEEHRSSPRQPQSTLKNRGCSAPSRPCVTGNHNKLRCWICFLQEVKKFGKLFILLI